MRYCRSLPCLFLVELRCSSPEKNKYNKKNAVDYKLHVNSGQWLVRGQLSHCIVNIRDVMNTTKLDQSLNKEEKIIFNKDLASQMLGSKFTRAKSLSPISITQLVD